MLAKLNRANSLKFTGWWFKLIRRKCAAEEYKPLEEGKEAHWQVVERILFIYSKLNPGVGYVQVIEKQIWIISK